MNLILRIKILSVPDTVPPLKRKKDKIPFPDLSRILRLPTTIKNFSSCNVFKYVAHPTFCTPRKFKLYEFNQLPGFWLFSFCPVILLGWVRKSRTESYDVPWVLSQSLQLYENYTKKMSIVLCILQMNYELNKNVIRCFVRSVVDPRLKVAMWILH